MSTRVKFGFLALVVSIAPVFWEALPRFDCLDCGGDCAEMYEEA